MIGCAEPVESDLPTGPQIPSIDSDANISIVTWNIENFPQQGARTTARVELIMDSLDADIYCLQEIQDKAALENIVDQLQKLARTCVDFAGIVSITFSNFTKQLLFDNIGKTNDRVQGCP